MNNEFFEALLMLEAEKNIPADYLLEKIKNAIVIAVKKDYDAGDNVIVEINPAKNKFLVAISKEAVEEVEDPATQISLDDALRISPKAKLGMPVEIKLETKEFGRIAAQTAKHVIRQGIREAERSKVLAEFQSKENEIVSAVVQRIDNRKGLVILEIGGSETVLQKSGQVPGEVLREGEHIKVYVAEVADTEKGPKISVSRSHSGLVKRMFEMEVPEIFDGTVEIKAISREAGSRTKIAVFSKNSDVDPIGACIGARGTRVAKIVDELNGEKIDVIKYSDKIEEFIAASLSPANVLTVDLDPSGSKVCKVTVPDHQLSLAIGNKGQNARLAARLTGWKIDIHPESGFYGE